MVERSTFGHRSRAPQPWTLAIATWLSCLALARSPISAQQPPAGNPSAPEPAGAPASVDAGTPPQPIEPAPEPAPEPAAEQAPAPNPATAATAATPTAPPLEPTPAPVEAPGRSDDDDKRAHEEQNTDAIPGDPWGDGGEGISTGVMSFRVLLQTRYTATFAPNSDNPRPGYALREDILARDGDGWSLNRFFLRVGADPTEQLRFRAIIDFAELASGNADNAIKQAYATLRPLPKHLELHAGIFKLPYSTMELDPIARYEFGSLGPTDDLIKNLGFGGRDIGADVMVAPFSKSKWLRIYVGTFSGHSHDEHASPFGAVGARVESVPAKGLRFGADVIDQPYTVNYPRPFETSNKDVLPMPDDPLFPRARHWASGAAYSADITFERWHLMLRAEGLLGARVDVDTRYGARNFLAAWALAAYRFRVGPVRLMPALRIEWLDADREHATGARRVLGASLTCFFSKRIRLLVDVTRSDVEPDTPVLDQPRPLPGIAYYELDATKLVTQLQVEI